MLRILFSMASSIVQSRVLHSLDPSSMMKPEDIVENYWYIAHQAKSTWSHEIDLHPHS